MKFLVNTTHTKMEENLWEMKAIGKEKSMVVVSAATNKMTEPLRAHFPAKIAAPFFFSAPLN